MKKFKNYLLPVVVLIGILYIILAFTNWSLNPIGWGGFSRFIFIVFLVITLIKARN